LKKAVEWIDDLSKFLFKDGRAFSEFAGEKRDLFLKISPSSPILSQVHYRRDRSLVAWRLVDWEEEAIEFFTDAVQYKTGKA